MKPSPELTADERRALTAYIKRLIEIHRERGDVSQALVVPLVIDDRGGHEERVVEMKVWLSPRDYEPAA